MQITSPKRARHLDEYTQNVLEEETRYDDVRSRRPYAVAATRLRSDRFCDIAAGPSDRLHDEGVATIVGA